MQRVQITAKNDDSYTDNTGRTLYTIGDYDPAVGDWVWCQGQWIYGHMTAGGEAVVTPNVLGAPFISEFYYGYIDGNLNYRFINEDMEKGHLGEYFEYFVNNFNFAWFGYDRDLYRNDGKHIHIDYYPEDIDVDDEGNLLYIGLDGNYNRFSTKEYTDPKKLIALHNEAHAGHIGSDFGFAEGHIKSFAQAYKDTVVHRTTTNDDRDINYDREYFSMKFTDKNESEMTGHVYLLKNNEIIKDIDLKEVLSEFENDIFDYVSEIDINPYGDRIGTPPDPYIVERHNTVRYCCITNDKSNIFMDCEASVKILLPVYFPGFETMRIDFDYYWYNTFHVLGFGHIFPYVIQKEHSTVTKGYNCEYCKSFLNMYVRYTYDHGKIQIHRKNLDYSIDMRFLGIQYTMLYCDLSNMMVFGKNVFNQELYGSREYVVSSDLYYVGHDVYAEGTGDFYIDMPPTQVKAKVPKYKQTYQGPFYKDVFDRNYYRPVHDYWVKEVNINNGTINFDENNIEISYSSILSAYEGTKKGNYFLHSVYNWDDCMIIDGNVIPQDKIPGYCEIQNYRIRDYHNVVQLLDDIKAVVAQIQGGA